MILLIQKTHKDIEVSKFVALVNLTFPLEEINAKDIRRLLWIILTQINIKLTFIITNN